MRGVLLPERARRDPHRRPCWPSPEPPARPRRCSCSTSIFDRGTRRPTSSARPCRTSRSTIFTLSEEADPAGFTRAWGAALVLLAFILLAGIGARALLARSRSEARPMRPRRRRSRRPTVAARAPARADPERGAAAAPAAAGPPPAALTREVVFDVRDLSVSYGGKLALAGRRPRDLPQPDHGGDRTVGLREDDVPAQPQPDERLACPGLGIDGPDPLPRARPHGREVDRVEVRRRIGMVFQKPNPFPKSIYDNIAWAPRNLGMKAGLDERVERALRGGGALGRGQGPPAPERAGPVGRPAAAPVHRPGAGDRARRPPARRAGVGARPDRHGVDRDADADLKDRYTIVIVTHNMQQAARVADRTAFFSLDVRDGGGRARSSSTTTRRRSSRVRPTTRTHDYVTGRFG